MATLRMRRGFAHIVQEQGEVQQPRPLQRLQQRRIMLIRLGLGLPDLVKLLQADQRMLIRGILMVKLVLYQARQFAEFGNVFAE